MFGHAQALGNLQAYWIGGFVAMQFPVGMALDTIGPRRTVPALMMAAVRDTGAGLLLVSHNPGYGALADRVLRLEGGRLVELKGHRHE